MKSLARILFLATLTTLAAYAFAQPGPGEGQSRGQPLEMLKHLGLTDDQAKQVSDLWTQNQTAAAPQRAQIRVLNAQIELALTTSHADLGAINALVDKKTQLQGELQKQRLATVVQIHQIVGDPLFYQLKDHWLSAHRKAGWGFHPGQGPGSMPTF